MKDSWKIAFDAEGLKRLLEPLFEQDRRRLQDAYPGLEYPAQGALLPVANNIVLDFKRTSGLFESRSEESEEKVVGRFGIGVDLTPVFVAVVTWVLKSVLDEFRERRKKGRKKPIGRQSLSAAERQEIRRLVVDFGRRLGDREMLTPEVTVKLADSVERVISKDPQLLLNRDEADED